MTQFDKRFEELIEDVFDSEGREYTNRKNDRGGKTNWGLTQIAYDDYCIRRNLPHREVRTLSEDEIKKVYYEDFYKKIGADKEKNDANAYLLFDTAVNFHPITAKIMWDRSGHDFYKMLDRRRNQHRVEAQNPLRAGDLEGWLNRCDKVEKLGIEKLKKSNPKFFEQLTPFDRGYKGAFHLSEKDLNKSPKELERSKNRYLYMLNNKGIPTGLASSIDEQLAKPFTRKQIGKMTTDEYNSLEHKINSDLTKGLINSNIPDISGYIQQLAPESTIFTKELLTGLSDIDINENLADMTRQQQSIGIPHENELLNAIEGATGDVYVKSYTRDDGTKVNAYTRSRPSY